MTDEKPIKFKRKVASKYFCLLAQASGRFQADVGLGCYPQGLILGTHSPSLKGLTTSLAKHLAEKGSKSGLEPQTSRIIGS